MKKHHITFHKQYTLQ